MFYTRNLGFHMDQHAMGCSNERVFGLHYMNAKVIVIVIHNQNIFSHFIMTRLSNLGEPYHLVKWFEFHFTTKHRSELIMAKFKISALNHQC